MLSLSPRTRNAMNVAIPPARDGTSQKVENGEEIGLKESALPGERDGSEGNVRRGTRKIGHGKRGRHPAAEGSADVMKNPLWKRKSRRRRGDRREGPPRDEKGRQGEAGDHQRTMKNPWRSRRKTGEDLQRAAIEEGARGEARRGDHRGNGSGGPNRNLNQNLNRNQNRNTIRMMTRR